MWDDPATPADKGTVHEMGRGVLAATVTIDGTPVTVVTAHFKSKLISYPRQTGVVSGSRFGPNDEGERLRYAGDSRLRLYVAEILEAWVLDQDADVDQRAPVPRRPPANTSSTTSAPPLIRESGR